MRPLFRHSRCLVRLREQTNMADDEAGILKKREGSMLQSRIPSTRTIACTTPKSTSTFSNRSCGLRRLSSPFVSPILKRSCDGESEEIFSTPKRSKHDKHALSMASENCPGNNSQAEQSVELLTRKQDLIKTMQHKEDSLRKLKLVKMYRNKNDLTQLQALIDKWRTVSQEAAERLLGKIKLDPLPTMGQLLSNLQVDKELIHYSEEDEVFY